MTSKEIREMDISDSRNGSNPCLELQIILLREIAAQLAESNEGARKTVKSVPPLKPKYEMCDTVFPSGEKCVRPKNHHEWSKAKCSPTVKFMEYSADTQCEEAQIRVIENKKIAKMRKK